MLTLLRVRSAAFALAAFPLLGCEPSRSPAAAEPSSKATAPLASAPIGTASATATAPAPTAAAPSAEPAATEPHESAIGKKEILVVRFISPGDGTDHAAYDRLRSMLKTLPQVPPFVSHLWGKEGEHDECFDLSSLPAADRGAFLSRVNEAVRSSKKVTITENGICHEGR